MLGNGPRQGGVSPSLPRQNSSLRFYSTATRLTDQASQNRWHNSSPIHCSVAGSVGVGELGTYPSRITGNHSTVSSIVMASLALLMQEGRGEPAVHPPEPPCLDEEIAAQSPYGAPDASSARAMSRSGHSKIRKAPESDSRGAGRSLRQEARTITTRRP